MLQITYQTRALEYSQTREQWLERAAALMRDSLILQLGDRPYRISCGWPAQAAMARTKRRIGECWYPDFHGTGSKESLSSVDGETRERRCEGHGAVAAGFMAATPESPPSRKAKASKISSNSAPAITSRRTGPALGIRKQKQP